MGAGFSCRGGRGSRATANASRVADDRARSADDPVIVPQRMEVSATTQPASTTDADTVAIGCFEGEEPASWRRRSSASCSPRARRARRSRRSRWPTPTASAGCSSGLGSAADFTPERARGGGRRGARSRARALDAARSAGRRRRTAAAEVAGALVEGTILADYRFERYKSAPAATASESSTKQLERLIVSAPADLAATVAEAALVADAVNAARDLQNRPANDLTPTALAEHAQRARRGDRGAVGGGRGARGDRGARDGRLRRRRSGIRAGAGADHDAL